MSADERNSQRISVSEDKLRAMFAEFKLELFGELRKYASTTALESVAKTVSELAIRVGALELSHARQDGVDQTESRVSARQLAWAAVVVSLLGALTTIVWLNHG